MNARIIELIKNKELLQPEDLNLLKEEIKSKPYVQSLRALYLLGASRFDAGNYQQKLSETAAYTTDKKILYHLINGESVDQPQDAEIKDETSEEFSETKIPVAEVKEKVTEVAAEDIENKEIVHQETGGEASSPLPSVTPKPEPVYVKGELNRILFEGEEDFMKKEAPKIDLEASQESGQIVVADPELRAPAIFTEETAPTTEITKQLEAEENKIIHSKTAGDPVSGSPEAKVVENNTPQEKATVGDPSVLSFQRTAEFLPDIKMNPGKEQEAVSELPKPKLSKHEEEMRKLVEEVERKIKEKKAKENIQKKEEPAPETEEGKSENNEVSFGETQPFVVQKEQDISEHKINKREVKKENKTEPESEKLKEESTWKPMTLSNAKPDALIESSKQNEQKLKINQEKFDRFSERKENEESAEEKELPVMNVSFFAPTISTINKPDETLQEKSEEQDKSNVPHFLNTWQNWLKIDRTADKKEQSIEKIKAKAIEKFIESEPKISQLREEGSYVIKEKKDDISHLMTETLAKIYVEQKLYAKAIHAYEVLSKKHPEKKQYFIEKAQEVKVLRNPQ